ncbi:MAG: HEAT repeat domain-containing protein [Planctomycetes bacterium]|nr:HEAT repeat domain-containing protein [Planctomycetota bacterium]
MALSTSCSFCRHYPLLEVYPMGKAVRCPTCGGELIISVSGARFRLDRERWDKAEETPTTSASRANPAIYLIGASLVIVAVMLAGMRASGPPNALPLSVATGSATSELEKVVEVALARTGEFPAGTNANGHYSELSRREHQRRTDGFVLHLKQNRHDLRGLPFLMSPDCTLPATTAQKFERAALAVRTSLAGIQRHSPDFQKNWADTFFHQIRSGKPEGRPSRNRDEVAISQGDTVSALVQILEPENPDIRHGVIGHLKALPSADVSRLLARRAVFDLDRAVRENARETLRGRPVAEYAPVLLEGLRHPMAHVAQQSAQAVVFLDAKELTPHLIDLLNQPEPNAPFTIRIDGQDTPMVREVVRVNHHRNCLLCHPPSTSTEDFVRGVIPSPHEPLAPLTPAYYGELDLLNRSFVHADTTFLRQDFSTLLPVADAAPWPTMQRFDFLVRTRPALRSELTQWQELQAQRGNSLSPHRAAVVYALRELTGQDEGTSAEAWRKALGIGQ